jgi:tRNA(fMet)-specific endonuclease VapC
MTYLLGTNSWIDLLNHPSGKVAARLAGHAPSDVALCAVVLGELLVGAYKSSRVQANLITISQLQRQFICLPFDEDCADNYARIRAHLEKIGQSIGPYDLQIAGTAQKHGLITVTHNVAEFSRVPGLPIEDWLIP